MGADSRRDQKRATPKSLNKGDFGQNGSVPAKLCGASRRLRGSSAQGAIPTGRITTYRTARSKPRMRIPSGCPDRSGQAAGPTRPPDGRENRGGTGAGRGLRACALAAINTVRETLTMRSWAQVPRMRTAAIDASFTSGQIGRDTLDRRSTRMGQIARNAPPGKSQMSRWLGPVLTVPRIACSSEVRREPLT